MTPPFQAPAKILVVDDEPGLRRLIEKRLERSGYDPASAGSAAEALEWMAANEPDLMLLDLKLPDAEGHEVVEQLKEIGRKIPFIVITGQGDERVAVNMMKRGAADYLVKDKDFLEFLPSIVQRVLAQVLTEERLAAAEEQLRLVKAAVEEAQDAILVATAGPSPLVVFANRAFCSLTGIDPQTAEGLPVSTIERNATVCFWRALASEAPLSGENSVVSSSGASRTLECQIAPIKNEEGKITHWISIQRDITARKLADKALDARVRQQAAVARLGNRVLAETPLEELLQEAAHLLVETLDVNFSKVQESLPDGMLFLRSGAGWRPGYVGRTLIPAEGTPDGRALSRLEPVIYENIQDDPSLESPSFFREHGVVSGIAVPIHDRDQAFGVLGVETREKRRFTGDDVHFLRAMANVLSEALERRNSEKEILEASSREQQRIGQDLHDGLGQHLAGIELLSHVLEEELADEGRPEAEQASKIAERVREAIAQTRMLARGLSPVHIEADGLMSSLKELATGVEEIFKVHCQFHCPRPVPVADNDAATHLYRIAQEATNNAIKHGKAQNISISLLQKNGSRSLEISDDGEGLSDAVSPKGIGLRIMNRRATMIGGKFEIRKNRPKGVTVTCTIPVTSGIKTREKS